MTLKGDLTRVRMVFNYAYESGLTEIPIRYGKTLKTPSARVFRKLASERGERMFSRDEILEMVRAAGVQMRAMIYLGINCAFHLRFASFALHSNKSGGSCQAVKSAGLTHGMHSSMDTTINLRKRFGRSRVPKNVISSVRVSLFERNARRNAAKSTQVSRLPAACMPSD